MADTAVADTAVWRRRNSALARPAGPSGETGPSAEVRGGRLQSAWDTACGTWR